MTQPTKSKANIKGAALIYDVRLDPWLGQTNDMALIAPDEITGRAVALMKDGTIRRFGKASKALKAAEKGGKLLNSSTHGLPREAERFIGLAGELCLRKLVASENQRRFAALEHGQQFRLVPFKKKGDSEPDALVKEGQQDIRGSYLPHSKVGKTGIWWFGSPATDSVVMSEEQYQAWAAATLSAAAGMGVTMEEYAFMASEVNAEALKLMGSLPMGWTAEPLCADEVFSQVATVRKGSTVIMMAQNPCDLMDVIVVRKGVVKARVNDVVSIGDSHVFPGMLFDQHYSWGELAQAGHAALETPGVMDLELCFSPPAPKRVQAASTQMGLLD